MVTLAWQLEESYLSSKWCRADTYSAVLPDLQRVRARGAVLAPEDEKQIRQRSTDVSRAHAEENKAAAQSARLQPQPKCDLRRPLLPADAQQGPWQSFSRSEQDVPLVASPFFESALADEARCRRLLAATPDLKRLHLPEHQQFSPEFFNGIGHALPKLQEVCLRETNVGDEAIASIVANCVELRSLDVDSCDISSLAGVADLKDLRELRVARCSRAVTSEFVGSLRTLGKLETLDISFCEQVNDQALHQFAEGCKTLTWVSMAGCRQMTGNGILSVVRANPGIRYLSLALNTDLVNDEAMVMAVRFLKRVRFLDFSGCTQLHKLHHRLAMAIAKFCAYLEELSFAQSTDLADDEARQLLLGCQSLQVLDLSGCRYVNEETIVECMTQAHKLRKLVLNCVPKISDECLDRLCFQYPSCVFERHIRKYVDANDLAMVFGEGTAHNYMTRKLQEPVKAKRGQEEKGQAGKNKKKKGKRR